MKKNGIKLNYQPMETNNKQPIDNLTKKILKGLDLVSEKLIKEAKEKKQELVVSRDNKIVKLKF